MTEEHDFPKTYLTNGYLTLKWMGGREWVSSDTWHETGQMR
jgi:hypothetical protein